MDAETGIIAKKASALMMNRSFFIWKQSAESGLRFCRWLGYLGSNQGNAGVKVLCLTTWLYPKITSLKFCFCDMSNHSNRFFSCQSDRGEPVQAPETESEPLF